MATWQLRGVGNAVRCEFGKVLLFSPQLTGTDAISLQRPSIWLSPRRATRGRSSRSRFTPKSCPRLHNDGTYTTNDPDHDLGSYVVLLIVRRRIFFNWTQLKYSYNAGSANRNLQQVLLGWETALRIVGGSVTVRLGFLAAHD